MNHFKKNKSASRVMEILSLLSTEKRPLTLAEVSQMLNIPKSSAFEILYTMVDQGFLEENEKLKTFELGIKLYEIGASVLANTEMHQVVHPFLDEMSAKTGETAFLAIENQGELLYLDKAESLSSVRTTGTLGSRMPLYCTGLGKALLAAYSDDRVKEITGGGALVPKTPYTISHYDDLVRDLNLIRQRGYAIDNRENELEVFCVAAAIYDQFNKPIGAISIASLASKMNEDRLQKFSEIVVETALMISRRLGFLGKQLYFNFKE
ncbi:IclR family transcriptional regulator [Paenactinomyces guangxiensis]|nr:IclR family transcriptional regulator [Paenactinomyces guangxiensis]MBH8593420.1 IclR family transcriptional regulator [Paenactinomyces guangxiensis]